ncbi:MAG TPA: ribose-5-phosphate isomerase RpiA [Thermoleophilaceae bacterium]|nr:ribose-5-phosphate isomerase RpiA [Thermoleophilaceae bacterium]
MHADEPSPARDAASAAAIELIEPGTTIGLGSGRAVWRVVDRIAERWPERPPLRAVVASELTHARARAAGIEIVELDGTFELDLAIDGADELDRELRLIKGGGGALLREKIAIAAARRFVVVAETGKLVDRLGEGFRLPVEVARFAWRDTRRRLAELLPDPELRTAGDSAFLTDEGHHILDCAISANVDVDALADELRRIPGVLEHGLFIDMAEQALLGTPTGTVERLTAAR